MSNSKRKMILNECHFEGLSIAETESQGRGVFSDSPAKVDSYLAFIPSKRLITTHFCSQHPLVKEAFAKLSDKSHNSLVVILFLCIIHNEPDFSDYFRLLPINFTNAVHESNLEELAGTSLDLAVSSKLKSLESIYSANIEAFNCIQTSFEKFKWADSIWNTRKMELNSETMAICPLLDFCNHSNSPNAYWEFKNDGVVLLPNREIEQGEQIYISYGKKNDLELYFAHGFVLDQPLQYFRILLDFQNEALQAFCLQLGYSPFIELMPPDVFFNDPVPIFLSSLCNEDLGKSDATKIEIWGTTINNYDDLCELISVKGDFIWERVRLHLIEQVKSHMKLLDRKTNNSNLEILIKNVQHYLQEYLQALG